MPLGELFLSAFLQVLFDRLASRELLDYARQLRAGVYPELKTWEVTLMMIQNLLGDAENKQLTETAVKMWLDNLQDLAYDMEDILDEFAYEVLQRKLVAERQTTSKKVLNCIPSSFTSVRFNHRMRSNIKEISSRLKNLYEQRNGLGLQVLSHGTSTATRAPQRPLSTIVSTEPAVYGREEDKAKILAMVLTDEPSNANFRVIAIVGMGGIGKTTLAREVLKAVDDSIFDIKEWACVSDDFDVLRISKALLQSITSSSDSSNDLNQVQVQLKNAINGKKFLIVLDDVWNKNYAMWERLKAPFMTSAPGSKLIVTTRHADVASTMGSIQHYNLNCLSDGDCWSLFLNHAFLDGDNSPGHQGLEFIREKVVEKCKGSPLAATTLGGLLRSKSRDSEWKRILNSPIWDLPVAESDILPVLKLSYHHLPKHLKRCFAYCAVFPKDFEFDARELVLLWLAEGLIQESTNKKEMEVLGGEYFQDLLSRSLFQQSNSESSRFVMHDLIHDLAELVSRDTSFRLDKDNKQRAIRSERIRHASYISQYCDGKDNFEDFQRFDHLRTLLPVDKRDRWIRYIPSIVISDFIKKFKRLRVLSLRRYYITQVADAIGGLKHLRYLNLSGTMIRNLPESTSLLFNLQHLLLKDCCRLRRLPSKMKDLINMYHLDISGKNLLKEMPLGMKELKDLHILTNFIVGKGSGSSLEDLKKLRLLRGELCISGLENVLDLQATKGKILSSHEDLEKLSLNWCSKFDDLRNEEREENVLDMLQPHENIRELTIKYYGGTRFSSWLEHPSFPKMEVLELENCKKCKILPPFGLLGSLKKLSIKGMKGLESLGLEMYVEGCLIPFQSLETFSIVRCPKLIGGLPNNLPSLKKLVIRDCAQLVVECSSFPLLGEMEIDECKGIIEHDSIPLDWKFLNSITLSKVSQIGNWSKHGFENVEFLKIDGCEELICSWKSVTCTSVEKPLQEMHSLTSLKKLEIENCTSLDSFPEANFLPNLSSLTIRNCKSLKSLPERMKDKNACLESLVIDGCGSLTFIARGMPPSSLKRLEIRNCEKLQCLVEDDKDDACASSDSMISKENVTMSLLQSLQISNCPSLTCISWRGQLPMSLVYLWIDKCPELESIAERFDNNTCLRHICLWNCAKLKSIPEGLHHMRYLEDISIEECPSVVSFPERGLPNNTNLSVCIRDCEKLEALPDCMHNLDSLEIRGCPSLRSFLKESLPTNLTLLIIDGDLKIYEPLIGWALLNLTSLKGLWIFNCRDAVCFPQEEMGMILPASLISLSISNFPKLKYLSSRGFQSLTSFQYLWINNCPKLTSFPKAGLPSSLLQLHVRECPLLKRQCKKEKGKQRSKISHIPRVEIDEKFIYDSEEES